MIGLIGEKTGQNSYATVSLKQTIPSLQGRFMETVIASLISSRSHKSKINEINKICQAKHILLTNSDHQKHLLLYLRDLCTLQYLITKVRVCKNTYKTICCFLIIIAQ